MTVKNLIESALAQNPSQAEKAFEQVAAEKLNEALNHKKSHMIAELFGIMPQDEDAAETTEEE